MNFYKIFFGTWALWHSRMKCLVSFLIIGRWRYWYHLLRRYLSVLLLQRVSLCFTSIRLFFNLIGLRWNLYILKLVSSTTRRFNFKSRSMSYLSLGSVECLIKTLNHPSIKYLNFGETHVVIKNKMFFYPIAAGTYTRVCWCDLYMAICFFLNTFSFHFQCWVVCFVWILWRCHQLSKGP